MCMPHWPLSLCDILLEERTLMSFKNGCSCQTASLAKTSRTILQAAIPNSSGSATHLPRLLVSTHYTILLSQVKENFWSILACPLDRIKLLRDIIDVFINFFYWI